MRIKMNNLEFTFNWYDGMLKMFKDQGYSFVNYHTDISPNDVILRHDVDWSPRKAKRLAEIEAERGVSSTYFFLVSSTFYNIVNNEVREQMEYIQELGHEIGLHFSVHQYFDSMPNDRDKGEEPLDEELIKFVNDERSILRIITGSEADVVSFHNPPSWTFRRSFDGFVSTYEKRFFEDIEYVADSNQRWRSDSPFNQEKLAEKLQILTHPVLWGEHDGSVSDRLREERDYLDRRISDHLEITFDQMWNGPYGLE